MMRSPSLPPAVLFAIAAGWAASSQAQDVVRIGQETKRASGTIVSMNAGDTACSLTLKDDKGATFREMAAFEICDQGKALINRRVALTYTQQKVQAPSCQGDPDCKKSVTVVLVSAARPLAAPTTKNSHCSATEQVVFSCRIGERLVSVCSSKDAGAGRGYLQYRFGAAASTTAPELSLPEGQAVPAKAARGAIESFSGGGGAWLRFANGPTAYTVYTGIGKWGPKGEIRDKAGVVVERGGKEVASLKCSDKPRSLLGPDWFDKTGVTRGNVDFDFPD
ncbi:MAG: hypothetical protein JSR90_12715 [Proteobacteria bacterium]|nr:hypothetical protein [Pseudomonadota bacterium]